MANTLSPILIVRLSDLFCDNGLDPDHVAKEFHEEAVQIGNGPHRMQEKNPLHVTGRGGKRGSLHNTHPRKVLYFRVLIYVFFFREMTLQVVSRHFGRSSDVLLRICLLFRKF